MRSTEDREWRRVERWFKRAGPMADVSDEAFELLGLRADGPPTSIATLQPLFVIGIVILGSVFFSDAGLGTAHWQSNFTIRMLATFGVISVAGLLMEALVIRADRRIAQTLPNRTSRGTAVPLRLILGTVRLTYLVGALVVEGGLAATLVVTRGGWAAWTFLAAYVVVCGLVTFGVRQAATRAAIALDPSSLAIDERLRSEEAFASLSPLFSLVIAFPNGLQQNGPAWLATMWFVGVMLVVFLSSWAALAKPWKSVVLRPQIRLVADGTDPWVKR